MEVRYKRGQAVNKLVDEVILPICYSKRGQTGVEVHYSHLFLILLFPVLWKCLCRAGRAAWLRELPCTPRISLQEGSSGSGGRGGAGFAEPFPATATAELPPGNCVPFPQGLWELPLPSLRAVRGWRQLGEPNLLLLGSILGVPGIPDIPAPCARTASSGGYPCAALRGRSAGMELFPVSCWLCWELGAGGLECHIPPKTLPPFLFFTGKCFCGGLTWSGLKAAS